MIAVIKVGGHQALVTQGEVIEVDKLDLEIGKTVSFETLLLSDEDGKNFKLGTPILSETVEAKITEHGRGKKIRVYKMKPRKRYRRTQGHRQDYTVIEITKIGTTTKTPVVKKETKKASKEKEIPKTVSKKSAKKPTPKKE